ncbi:hypothetical protein BDP55DRAFT_746606 [Colletotrichum godetiae]|uniref:Uncharacterized protein n=1 Tax=Colletotrichum godetiae TaxID=1209918 RepID=A0AAJ0ERP4_9PEZI|nr:uncharacterized protein BDP55DRAFT_746606 [Colletotrichum godetiae]KAK1674166.1 hypothetical protein BDP55DRAFT_746606 [Colletotrichum godetiae]
MPGTRENKPTAKHTCLGPEVTSPIQERGETARSKGNFASYRSFPALHLSLPLATKLSRSSGVDLRTGQYCFNSSPCVDVPTIKSQLNVFGPSWSVPIGTTQQFDRRSIGSSGARMPHGWQHERKGNEIKPHGWELKRQKMITMSVTYRVHTEPNTACWFERRWGSSYQATLSTGARSCPGDRAPSFYNVNTGNVIVSNTKSRSRETSHAGLEVDFLPTFQANYQLSECQPAARGCMPNVVQPQEQRPGESRAPQPCVTGCHTQEEGLEGVIGEWVMQQRELTLCEKYASDSNEVFLDHWNIGMHHASGLSPIWARIPPTFHGKPPPRTRAALAWAVDLPRYPFSLYAPPIDLTPATMLDPASLAVITVATPIIATVATVGVGVLAATVTVAVPALKHNMEGLRTERRFSKLNEAVLHRNYREIVRLVSKIKNLQRRGRTLNDFQLAELAHAEKVLSTL